MKKAAKESSCEDIRPLNIEAKSNLPQDKYDLVRITEKPKENSVMVR